MTDLGFSAAASETFKQSADTEKRIGELAMLFAALRLALDDLVPHFEVQFSKHLEGQEVLGIKHQYEHRIRGLLEASHKLSGK